MALHISNANYFGKAYIEDRYIKKRILFIKRLEKSIALQEC